MPAKHDINVCAAAKIQLRIADPTESRCRVVGFPDSVSPLWIRVMIADE